MVAAFGTFIPETHSEYRLVRGCWFNKSGKTVFFRMMTLSLEKEINRLNSRRSCGAPVHWPLKTLGQMAFLKIQNCSS